MGVGQYARVENMFDAGIARMLLWDIKHPATKKIKTRPANCFKYPRILLAYISFRDHSPATIQNISLRTDIALGS